MNETIADTEPTAHEAQLESLWKELLTTSPDRRHYLDLVQDVPFLKQRAWQAYLALQPTLEELFDLYVNNRSEKDFRTVVLDYLLEKNSTDALLLELFKSAASLHEDEYKIACKFFETSTGSKEMCCLILHNLREHVDMCDKAAEMLLKHSPTSRELECILKCASPSMAKAAGERMLNMHNVGIDSLRFVLQIEDLRQRAWNEIKDRKVDFSLLSNVIFGHYPELDREIAEMILAEEIPAKSLYHILLPIFEKMPDMRERVWQKYNGMKLYPAWVGAIIRIDPSFEERANACLKPLERTTDHIMIEIRQVARSLD